MSGPPPDRDARNLYSRVRLLETYVQELRQRGGSPGPPGPPGQSLLSGEYRWDTSTTSGDPGSGRLRANSATPTAITQLYVSTHDWNGNDQSMMLATARAGDRMGVSDPSDTSHNFNGTVGPGNPVNNTGWWTVPVTGITASGGSAGNNAQVLLQFATTGPQGPAGGLTKLSETVVNTAGVTAVNISVSPTTYRLLHLIWTGRKAAGSVPDVLWLRYNLDSSNNYYGQTTSEAGTVLSTAQSAYGSAQTRVGSIGCPTDAWMSGELVIWHPYNPMGRVSGRYWQMRNDANVTGNIGAERGTFMWIDAAASTTISLFPNVSADAFAIGTTFTLLGIL